MGIVRRKSIISGLIIGTGFILGVANTWLFTHKSFVDISTAQYGFIQQYLPALATLLCAFVSFGITNVIYKYFPYYKEHTTDKKNDLFTIAILVAIFGTLILLLLGKTFIHYYNGNETDIQAKNISAEFINYSIIFSIGLLFFTIAETFSILFGYVEVSVFTRELYQRLITLILLVLFSFKIISFKTFALIFCFTYASVAIVLFGYLYLKHSLRPVFKFSSYTKLNYKAILGFGLSQSLNTLAAMVSANYDVLKIKKELGFTAVGIFTFANFTANLILIPLKSVVNIAAVQLSNFWKDNDFASIQKIYKQTSNTFLFLGLLIYGNILISFFDAVQVFHLKDDYNKSQIVFVLLGIKYLIDLGTGLNNYVIYFSPKWKFEIFIHLFSIVINVVCVNIFVERYGLIGAPIAGIVAIFLANALRFIYIYKWFKLNPFTYKLAIQIATALILIFSLLYLYPKTDSIVGLSIRCIIFSVLFLGLNYYLKSSEQINNFINMIWGKLKIKLKSN